MEKLSTKGLYIFIFIYLLIGYLTNELILASKIVVLMSTGVYINGLIKKYGTK